MSDACAIDAPCDLTRSEVVVEDLALPNGTPRVGLRVGEEAAGGIADDVCGVVVVLHSVSLG